MNPQTRRAGLVARPEGAGLIILGPDHLVLRLDARAAWLWQHADGSRDIEALFAGLRTAVDADASREDVFSGLDQLGDAGLLMSRAAPPASVTRRAMLERLGGASALTALLGLLGAATPAAAAAADNSCQDDKEIIEEIAYLEAQERAVATLLDEWVDEATKAEEPDEFYIAALDARERDRKKSADAYGDDLDDATVDLAACKVGDDFAREAVRKKKIEAAAVEAKIRSEARAKHNNQRAKQQVDRSIQHEASRKKQIATEEKKKASVGAPVEGTEARMVESRHKERERKRHVDEQVDARVKASEQRAKAIEHRRTERDEKSHGRILSMERRFKLQAEAQTERKSEKAHKAMDGSSLTLALAEGDAAAAAKQAVLDRYAEQKAKQDSYAEQKAKQSSAEAEQKKSVAAEQTEKKEMAAKEQAYKASAEMEQKKSAV